MGRFGMARASLAYAASSLDTSGDLEIQPGITASTSEEQYTPFTQCLEIQYPELSASLETESNSATCLGC